MSRIIPFFLTLGLMLGMGSSQSLAYTQEYLDNTLVQASDSGSGYIQDHWYDIIGNNNYELYKIDVTWSGTDVIIGIYTNTSGSRIGSDYVADIAIDLDQNGVWETGIVLKNVNRASSYDNNTLYTFSNTNNSHWLISDNFSNIPGTYGKNYDRSNDPNPAGNHDPYDPPVLLTTNVTPISSQTITAVWGVAPNDSPTSYLLTLTLTGVNEDGDWNNFDILWGTQTCANDTMYAQVHAPIPASVFLLGSGLLGLSLVGWRRKTG